MTTITTNNNNFYLKNRRNVALVVEIFKPIYTPNLLYMLNWVWRQTEKFLAWPQRDSENILMFGCLGSGMGRELFSISPSTLKKKVNFIF